ncbi:ribosome biogenesis regulatory protein-domain-containing protein [Syncephalis fuscata]|nr:ribosome biogenesis regulatory protein-domain-containing protein [Syncephalis fuscata]
MDVTEQIKQAESERYKAVMVERLLPPEHDLALLASFDRNPLDDSILAKSEATRLDAYLREYARGSTQLLFNAIFQLPTDSSDAGILARLPDEIRTPIPREKPVPKPKPLTKWEKFAKQKGIQKRKRDRMVMDEATGEYKPRWGYGRVEKDGLDDWAIEVKDSDNPLEDQFAKRRQEKKERIAKNKSQEMRNLSEAQSAALDPRAGRQARKEMLDQDLRLSRTATASMGRFDKKMDNEPKQKGIRRKFEANEGKVTNERERSMKLLDKVIDKDGTLNVTKAVKMQRQGK